MLAVLALLAAAAGTNEVRVAIVVEEATGIDGAQRDTFLTELERALEGSSGLSVVLDRGLWSDCASGTRCASAIRAGAGVSDVLFVRLFRAGTRARFIAERVDQKDTVVNRVQMDLDYDELLQAATLKRLASLIYEPRAVPEITAVPPPLAPTPEPDRTVMIAGLAAIGAGAIAAGTGVAFRLSGDSAADRVEAMPLPPSELEDERNRAQTHLTLSNFLFGGAAALISAGVVAVLLE